MTTPVADDHDLISLPGGQILIGAPRRHLTDLAGEQPYPTEWFGDETPRHALTLAPFRLARHPVTNAQFTRFAEASGYRTDAERRGFGLVYGRSYWEDRDGANWRHPAGPGSDLTGRQDHPVVHISLADATAYCTWAGLRLPTEAEWEYAAHGPHWRPWPWGQHFDPGLANCAEHWAGELLGGLEDWRRWWSGYHPRLAYGPATTPVGQFDGASPFGIDDMAGNVNEWTSSVYWLYAPEAPCDQVMRYAQGRYVTIRGGGWMNLRWQVRTTERVASDATHYTWASGFRCAADEPDEFAGEAA
ncbi:SUMF1/EgtB/PvdO family nonheme iron enzyme [Streptosporangium sp. NPDC020072]|uniref:formylglycine-generating enzyme family protein n=1 Tax=Streptosporangium sp. NPDC020072 TaxID=3154788 RepID=UPI00341D387D